MLSVSSLQLQNCEPMDPSNANTFVSIKSDSPFLSIKSKPLGVFLKPFSHQPSDAMEEIAEIKRFGYRGFLLGSIKNNTGNKKR